MIDIRTALTAAARDLRVTSDSSRLDAELLLMFVLGEPRGHLFAHPDRKLNCRVRDKYAALVARRFAGEPIAYITGEKEFWSLPLKVTMYTLVPRPETELLVEQALARIPSKSRLRILDLGTGNGAIAVAIASERSRCTVVATDISAPALAVARANARRHQLSNITFLQGDWLAPLGDQEFDIIVSNPPYVASWDPAIDALSYEPVGALVAAADGLAAIRKITGNAGAHLIEKGTLVLEHGADQKDAVAGVLAQNGWTDVCCHRDLQRLPRVTIATRGSGGLDRVR